MAIALLAIGGYFIRNLINSKGGDSEPSSTQETSVVTEYLDPTTTQVQPREENEVTNETPQEVTITETEPTNRDGNQAPNDNLRQPQPPYQQAPTRNQQNPNTPMQQRQPQQQTQQQQTHVENTPEQKNTVNSQPDELPGDLSDLLRQDGD